MEIKQIIALLKRLETKKAINITSSHYRLTIEINKFLTGQ